MKLSLLILAILSLSQQIPVLQGEVIDDPTLKPIPSYNPKDDGEIIWAETKPEVIPNQDKIMQLWFHRTYHERKQIANYYETNFCPRSRCALVNVLIQQVSGCGDVYMKELYGLSLMASEGTLAQLIHQTITENKSEMGGIEEVVCANDKEMKDRVNEYYESNYSVTVEQHLGMFRSDDQDYQHVMLQYCWRGTCQNTTISSQDADKEAQALYDINPKKHKSDFKNKLKELFDKYCEPDLKLIFEKYRQGDYGISDAVNKAFKNKRERRAFKMLVKYIENTCEFYADELEDALGDGIKEDKINRIILTRCERDLLCIMKKFHNKHDRTFTSRLEHAFNARRWIENPWDAYVQSIRYLCANP